MQGRDFSPAVSPIVAMRFSRLGIYSSDSELSYTGTGSHSLARDLVHGVAGASAGAGAS